MLNLYLRSEQDNMATVLGIETSCDETAVAIYDCNRGLCGHHVYSQIAMHQPFGGVVPELASRDHASKLLGLVKQTLAAADISLADIDAIAYTAGPGLAGALMVGAGFATALAQSIEIPTIPVHHLEAHMLVAFLESAEPTFPFLALLVSGGHTQIIEAKSLGDYVILADTLDDAIGEAFDKTAKLLGLPYPGGRALSELAQSGDATRFPLPRPMRGRPGYDMSFSGLKTAVFQAWESCEQTPQDRCDLAASFQVAVADSCCNRLEKLLRSYRGSRLIVAGGVAANTHLRSEIEAVAKRTDCLPFFPPIALCTDNGAMVAYAGYLHYKRGLHGLDAHMQVYPRWPIESYGK
jgi:N6-L-threonylcarbamoyladenine synthase